MCEKTFLEIKGRKKKKEILLNSKTRTAKRIAQYNYQESCDRVKKTIVQEKQNYVDKLAEAAEEAAKKGKMRDVYQYTRKLSGKFKKVSRPVKSKEGKTIASTNEQKQRWVEHFEEVLNRPDPDNLPQIEEPPDLPINCNPSNKEEILKAIKLLKF